MRKLKLLIIPCLLFLGMVVGNAFADNLQVSTTNQIMTTCNGGTFPIIYYAGASAITATDTFKSSSKLIWRFLADSSVSIYNPYNLVNFPSPLSTAFPFYSNGKPPTVNSVVVTATPITISSTIPAGYQSRNTIATQMVYTIRRYERGYTAGSNNSVIYFPEGGSSSQTFYYNNASPVNSAVWDNECRNIYVGFCGDGIVDNTDQKSATITGGSYTSQQLQQMLATKLAGGEECDLGANNGKPGYNCTADCKLVTKPTCTLTLSPTPVCVGNTSTLTRAINGSYTNTPGITANPTLTGFPYSVTAANGTRQITPTTWGTWNFNMSVSNTAGSNSCTATLVVNGCGDGIKNCGEACDPNDPTKSGWGNGGCSATCQPINITKPTCTLTLSPTPVCVGNTSTLTRAINGSYTNTPSITANPTLTGFPYSVTAANGTRQITPTTWGTWNFNMSVSNTAGSNSCTATLVVNGCGDGIKNCGEACDPNDPTKSGWGNGGCSATCQPITLSLGQPVIKKELISPATVNYVGETVKWRITVTASGGSISGFEIKDTLPDQLEYVNYSVVTSNGTTVSLQTIAGPVITWKVVGTLQQNQSVVLELTTRVISLPANITKLQNIACVRYNNVQKDCKDAFVPIGRPVIVKTLISPPSGGVSKVGELVKWKITVTASGGSIKDFEIKDILPSQLEYVNYSVLTSNGTTVSLQTISPSVPQTVTRKVMGTLPQNQSVVLELTTRVISLPPALAEIKNVACVQILTGISGNSTSGGTVVALKQSGPGETVTKNKTLLASTQPGILLAATLNGTEPPLSSQGICDNAFVPVGRAVVEKTPIGSGLVTATGQEIQWKITVTASGGNIKDFEIKDILPNQLEYADYSVLTANGTTISLQGVVGQVITWKVTGTLLQNQKVELLLTTRVVILPAPNENIINVACVWDNIGTGGVLIEESCDEGTLDKKPGLWIKKTFMDGGTGIPIYAIGDVVGYKIDFGNTGSADAIFVALEDYLPQNLEYVSSQLFMNPPYNAGQYRSGGVFVDAYSGMILPPGASGYLLLTGKILDTNLNSTTNVACVRLYSTLGTGLTTRPLCDQVTYKVKPMDLGITKKVSYNNSVLLDSVQVPGGSEVVFTIFVKNNGTTPVSGFSVRDTLPMEVEFVDWVNGTRNSAGFASRHHDRISGSEILVWSGYQDLLLPGDQIILKFRAKVDIPNGTIRTNIACLEYSRFAEGLSQGTYCDTASVETKEKQYCVAPTTSPGGTIRVTGNEEKRVTVTCSTSDGKVANIKMYCDRNQGVAKQGNASSLSTDCWYSLAGSQTIRTFYPYCEVDGSSTAENGRICEKGVTLTRNGGLGYCGDGIAEDWEDCDCRNGSKNCSSNFDINPRLNGSYNGYICKNCKLEGGEGGIDPIACFNVNNGSISINKGEILPFYWNIERVDNKRYVEAKGGNYQNALDNYSSLLGSSCSNYRHGDIALDAMKCTFIVYNGEKVQSNNQWVYKIEAPCFTRGSAMQKDWEKSDLIQSFIKRNTSNFNDGGGNTMWSYNIINDQNFKFRSSVFLIDNFGRSDTNMQWTDEGQWKKRTNINGEITAFGEYKLSLDEVNYVQCIDGKWKAQDPYPRVCEVDFAVTNNYILQKTPSGTIKGTTESLAKYFMYANGTPLREDTLLGNILATTANDYQDVDGKVKTAMDNFIAKYSKLAVAVPASPFGGSATVKKVPGKSIYFVEGNLDIKSSSSSFTAPFTIVQTKGDTTIKGSISHNMMLLTKGKITFDVADNCSDSQVVKGIFYANGGFSSLNDGNIRNNNLNHKKWCIGGNLHIRGIVIGQGLQDVMNKRRSNLNGRFYTPGSPALDKATRRNYVMNGASVLIEYSPSIFTTATMPPGAEEFMTALEVYRR